MFATQTRVAVRGYHYKYSIFQKLLIFDFNMTFSRYQHINDGHAGDTIALKARAEFVFVMWNGYLLSKSISDNLACGVLFLFSFSNTLENFSAHAYRLRRCGDGRLTLEIAHPRVGNNSFMINRTYSSLVRVLMRSLDWNLYLFPQMSHENAKNNLGMNYVFRKQSMRNKTIPYKNVSFNEISKPTDYKRTMSAAKDSRDVHWRTGNCRGTLPYKVWYNTILLCCRKSDTNEFSRKLSPPHALCGYVQKVALYPFEKPQKSNCPIEIRLKKSSIFGTLRGDNALTILLAEFQR